VPRVRVCAGNAESMEYDGRSGLNSPRNSFVELTAAETLAVPSIGHDVV
jgi:hypothetical protein